MLYSLHKVMVDGGRRLRHAAAAAAPAWRCLLLCLLAFALVPAALFARERTPEEADSIARATFLSPPKGVHRIARPGQIAAPKRIARSLELVKGSREAFYVYSPQAENAGYVIVSADDCLPAVLAYSPDGSFPLDDMPPAMTALLQTYCDLLAAMPAGTPARAASLKEVQLRSIEPLMGDIAYGQRFPFNYFCPTISGQSTLTGCVATAASQICRYYAYPSKMQGDAITYTSASNGLQVYWDCASTTFDWDKTLPAYASYAAPYAGGETVDDEPLMVAADFGLDETKDQCFKFTNFGNVTGSSLAFTASVLVFSAEGSFIRPAGVTEQSYSGLGAGYYFPNYSLSNIALPGDLPDGTYRLVPVVKREGTTEWHPVKKSLTGYLSATTDLADVYVEAVKSGNMFTMGGKTFRCAYSDAERDAVATLHAACGAMVEMDYGLGSSGATSYKFMEGMATNMGYDKSLALIDKDQFTEDGWVEAVLAELDQSRLVYVSGQTSSGNGHAYLIDGATSTGDLPYFHINWGWTGSCNGYFLLSHMEPEGGEEIGDFSYQYSFVTGVMPADGVERGYPFGANEVAATMSTESGWRYAALSYTKLQNIGVRDFAGKVNAYAENASGSYFLGSTSISSLPAHYYYGSISYTLRVDNAIPEGDYTIRIAVQADGDDVERTIYTPEFPVVHIDASATPMTVAEVPAGKFYTIYNQSRGAFMGSSATGKQPKAATAAEAGIYYVTADGRLLSYDQGRFLSATAGAPCGATADAATFTFGTASAGRYYLYSGGYLALGTETADRLALADNTAAWTFQEVTELPLTINATAQYATLCLPVAFSVPEGVTAYKATQPNSGKLQLEEIDASPIAANTPVVLYKEGGGKIAVTLHGSGEDVAGNNLVGTELGGTTVPASETAYILALVSGEAGFYRLNATDRSIASFKAYYVATSSNAPAFLPFDAVTTGVVSLPTAAGSPAAVYDLQGRRVAKPRTGGIYIIDGKKVLIR